MSGTEIPDDFWNELVADMAATPEAISHPRSAGAAAFEAAGGDTAFSQVYENTSPAVALLQRLAPSQESVTLERQRQLAVEDAVFERMMADPIMTYHIKNWESLPAVQREQVAAEIARTHSHTLGYDAPDVSGQLTGFARAGEVNGQYVSSGVLGGVNRIEVDMERPFAKVLESVLHENTHNHQDQLRLRGSEGMSSADRSLQEIMQVTWDRAEHQQTYFHLPREVHARDWQAVGERLAQRAGLISLDPEQFPDRNRPYATQYNTVPEGLGSDNAVRYYTTETLTRTMAAAVERVPHATVEAEVPSTRAAHVTGGASGSALGVYGLVSRAGQTGADLDANILAGLSSVVGSGADGVNVLTDAAGMIDDAGKGMSHLAQRAALPLAIVSTVGEVGAGIATGDEVRATKAVGGLGGALVGAKLLGTAGAVLGPWGAAAGGLVGGVAGGLLGEEAVEALLSSDNRGLSNEAARAEALHVLQTIPMHPDALHSVRDPSLQTLVGQVHKVVGLEASLIERATEQALERGDVVTLERLMTPMTGIDTAVELLAADPETARMVGSYNLAKTSMMNGLDAYVRTNEPEETRGLLAAANRNWERSEEYQWMLEDQAAQAGVTNAVYAVCDDDAPRGAADLNVAQQSTRVTQI